MVTLTFPAHISDKKILLCDQIFADESSVSVKIRVQSSWPTCNSKDEGSNQNIMQRQNVSSSRIKSIGYDAKQKTLEIEFFSSGIYQYVGVTSKTYETFLSVKSKGRFFDGVIKDKFLCRKIG